MADKVTFTDPRTGSRMTASPELMRKMVGHSSGAEVVPEPEDDRPAGNASQPDWHAYRLSHGYTAEELEGLGRNDLRDLDDR